LPLICEQASMSSTQSAVLRPVLLRRTEYAPRAPVEVFMVRLLKERVESLLAEYARPPSVGTPALDVGCGQQPFRSTLEDAGYLYYGLDVQPGPGVNFVAAVDEPLPEEIERVGPYQLILCTEVMEHVADWRTAFVNLYRLTAPRGRVIITCPHYYVLHEEPYDFWRPTLYAIRMFAERAGFRVIYQEHAGTPWDVFGTWLGSVSTMPSKRPIERLARSIFMRAKRLLFAVLCRGWIQRIVELRGQTYLSNIVVLERTES
jgi:SAM-dependent methyltransferase